MTADAMTALVLAGTRSGGDPLAQHAGVSHKALIDIGGQPMLQRVLTALAGTSSVARIVVVIERPDLVSSLPDCGKPVSVMPAQGGPSASVARALEVEATPLLVTTADHALLQARWIEEFLAADSGADAVVGLARREAVEAAVPQSQRTWLRFSDGAYSGCNLFLLRNARARGIVALWQQLEADRKRPLALLQKLGPGYAVRYRLGWLSLAHALQRLGSLSGTTVGAAILQDGRAAIDVDKESDLALVRAMVGRQLAR